MMNNFKKDFHLLVDGEDVLDGEKVAEKHLNTFKEELIQKFNNSDCEDYSEFIEEMNKTIKEVDKGDANEFEEMIE